MTETDRFINAYKRLEAALSSSTYERAKSVLEYENRIADRDKEAYDKLKTCRIIRNYITHHEDGIKMFPASKPMTEFLISMAEDLENRELTVGKLAKKTIVIDDDTTVQEAAAGFAALSGNNLYLPYVDAEGNAEIVPERIIADCMAQKKEPAELMQQKIMSLQKKSIKKVGSPQIVIANISDPAKRFEHANRKSPIIVVNTNTGSYKGMIQIGTI